NHGVLGFTLADKRSYTALRLPAISLVLWSAQVRAISEPPLLRRRLCISAQPPACRRCCPSGTQCQLRSRSPFRFPRQCQCHCSLLFAFVLVRRLTRRSSRPCTRAA